MTAQKCGEFIATLRKEKAMTQKELARVLNVSDKAISRWETGKGFPDVDSLVNLSEYFDVTVNELLAGERVEPELLSAIADNNILKVFEQNDKNQKRGVVQTFLAIVCFVFIMIPPAVEIIQEIISLKPVITGDALMSFIIQTVVSLCLVASGISIRLGNINLIHSYHYTRVTDRDGYCKAMSVPLIVLGILLIVAGSIMLLSTVHYIAEVISAIITIGSAVVCVLWIFRIQMKYNGGIF